MKIKYATGPKYLGPFAVKPHCWSSGPRFHVSTPLVAAVALYHDGSCSANMLLR